MDFTSDSTVRRSSSASAAGLAQSSSELEDGLPEADLQLIRLHEQRDSLISKRNRLLQELESLKRRTQAPLENVAGADARLMDLVLLSGPESATIGPAVETIDGSTDLQRELATKSDTLPLLNMQARLQSLRELYAGVELEVESIEDATATEVIVKAQFSKLRPAFHVTLKLKYREAVLVGCDVQDMSRSVRWLLRDLVRCQNPPRILLGCFEFDSLRERRSAEFDRLASAMSRYPSLVTVERESEACIRFARSVSPTAVLRVQWLIELADMWPSTTIATTLVNGSGELIDTEQIKAGLLREYGVSLGLQELCKACLCL
ncbi:hypothetical protein HG536_0B06380 [Torulaspora globosa]|uniref:Uncharacterized protein n=1 Tax=Torulaspora globosa TaxID=48254 RepID=A0A7G3ZE34_9SACH|nr:uncharacterized protein HG536_0B06380 [Torulaspora globosa]QLL31770.1 hypothetical protein HG536_0B06380 [Torulaspora globosa]